MQTTSSVFEKHASGSLRPLQYQVRASFDKAFDDDIDFFQLDSSLLNGGDVLAPSDNAVIQLWDKYEYQDISKRVIGVEVQSEQTEPYSIVLSMADITLNNYDGYFTPNSDSPVGEYILPRRPFRVLMGFGHDVVPLFIGLSTKSPRIDKQSRTVQFHCIDFLSYLFEQKIDQTITLLDYSTSEILAYLFDHLGLLSSQYDLDPVSFNRINYFYAEKGQSLGDIIRPLMEAEQGRLWLSELGVIKFLNRQNYPTASVATFNQSNVIDYSDSGDTSIINYAKITSEVLEEKIDQKIWELAAPEFIKAGATIDIWANLDNPITEADTPVYLASPEEKSYFTSTKDQVGEVVYEDVEVTSMDVFSTAVKLSFKNTGDSDAFLYEIVLFGNPVVVVDRIVVEESDDDSIEKYEEQRYELETNYIQSEDDAVSKAVIMVDDYKDFASAVELEVKGNPAYQIGDTATLNVDSYQGDHVITKLTNIMRDKRYTQLIRFKAKDPRQYFILSSDDTSMSLLNGTDVLSP